MKKKLKKVLFPVFLSIVCGAICGKLVYSMYGRRIDENLELKKIYLVQSGAYSNYDNMIDNVLLSNYVYYEDDDGVYKSIIGITEDYKNIDKIKNTYKENVFISQYYSNDKELNDKIEEYDRKLKDADNNEEIKKIVMKMLELYKDKNRTLIQMDS